MGAVPHYTIHIHVHTHDFYRAIKTLTISSVTPGWPRSAGVFIPYLARHRLLVYVYFICIIFLDFLSFLFFVCIFTKYNYSTHCYTSVRYRRSGSPTPGSAILIQTDYFENETQPLKRALKSSLTEIGLGFYWLCQENLHVEKKAWFV